MTNDQVAYLRQRLQAAEDAAANWEAAHSGLRIEMRNNEDRLRAQLRQAEEALAWLMEDVRKAALAVNAQAESLSPDEDMRLDLYGICDDLLAARDRANAALTAGKKDETR